MSRNSIVAWSAAALIGFSSAANAQVQPKVLAELFGNINCFNCRPVDDQYATYLAQHPEIVIINYHNSTSDTKDPFYVASKASADAREINLNGGQINDPSGYIDAISAQPNGAADAQTWETYSNQALMQPLPPIAVSGRNTSNGIVVKYSVPATGSGSAQIFVVLKESGIHFVNTELYGATPGDLWNDIMRIVLPAPAGGPTFSASATHTDSLVYNPADHPTWKTANMTAVVFAEDVSSGPHQILALGVLPLAQFAAVDAPTMTSARLLISGNPVTAQSRIGFELGSESRVRITISDMLGREVRDLIEGPMPAGHSSVAMSPQGLSDGTYIARMFVNGKEVDRAKLIYQQ